MNITDKEVSPLLLQMLDSSNDPVLLLDEQANPLAINHALSHLLEVERSASFEWMNTLLPGGKSVWLSFLNEVQLTTRRLSFKRSDQPSLHVLASSLLIRIPGKESAIWRVTLQPDSTGVSGVSLSDKNSTLYLEKLLQSITDGFLVMNKNGDILFCNLPAAELVRMRSPEELIGKNIWQVFPEINILKEYPAYPSIMENNRSLRFKEYFPAFKNWIELSVYPSEENLVIYFKDVTELVQRRKLQLLEREILAMNANPFKDLKEVLNNYLISVAQIYDGLPIVLWRLEGEFLQVSSVANVPDSLSEKITASSLHQSIWPAHKAVVEKKQVSSDEMRESSHYKLPAELLSSHGYIASAAYPVLLSSGQVWGALEIFYQEGQQEMMAQHDLPQTMTKLLSVLLESKLAQENIRLSNQRYDLISRATNDIIWEWDIAKGLLVKANAGLVEFFGIESGDEQILFNAWQKLLHPEDNNRVIKKRNEVLRDKTNQYWEDEFRMKGQSGKYNYFYHKAFIVRNAEGRAIRLFGATQNINRRKEDEALLIELNKQLKQRADELSASNVELERFAYVASHDMQEPLRMITSFLQLFRKKYQDQIDETAEQYLHFVMDGADRMKRLITDLLEYSRIGSNKGVAEPIDTAVVMKEIQEVFVNRIAECEATIICRDLPVIMGNKTQLFQLFQNLVGNALKYIGKDKPVVIVSGSEEENHFLFSVEDNGIGIKPMFFDKIFVLFQRLHHKHQYSGTGIGLSVCKKIVEKHGGKIWVTSEPDKGSTFYFTISKNLEQHAPGFIPDPASNV